MNEKEMLQAIFIGMQGMQQDIKEIKQDVAVLKQDVEELKQDVEELKQDVEELKQDVEELKQDVAALERRVTSIELHLENKTDHHIRILAENHISLMDSLNQAIPRVDKSHIYEIKIDYLTDKVTKLEKEVTDLKNKIA